MKIPEAQHPWAFMIKNTENINREKNFNRFDALLPDEAVSKAFHCRRRWIRRCAIVPCTTKQGRHPRGSTLFQLVDNALGNIAYGVNRADHLLFAHNDIVEQAFKLRRVSGDENARLDGASSGQPSSGLVLAARVALGVFGRRACSDDLTGSALSSVCCDDAVVLVAIKDASRRLRRCPLGILDRHCARRLE